MKHSFAFLLLVFLAACGTKEDSKNVPGKYFDIRAYFEQEAIRLQKQNPTIEKTVSQNSQLEKRLVNIKDWKSELELFSESDINKPAWKNSYLIRKNRSSVEYISTDNNLKTRKIEIYYSEKGAVNQIAIFNKTSNLLYTSHEKLTYYPDSLYTINKEQNVQIIGKNEFTISARFNR
jgi:hypothetical protein